MRSLKDVLSQPVSFRSSALLLVAIFFGGALTYGIYHVVSAYVLEARIRRTVPKVLEFVSADRDRLIKAIEAYHKQFGFYPPDHVIGEHPLRIDPVTNQLFYELVGAIFDPKTQVFSTDRSEPLGKRTVEEYFNVSSFKNVTTNAAVARQFLSRELLALKEIHDGPDVMVLIPNVMSLIEGIDYNVLWQWEISSWQYVTTAPTNNPGKYDLWCDLKAGGQTFRIRNW